MTQAQRPSCLMRIITGGIISLISAGASAVFIYLLTSAYPLTNPALYAFLTGNAIPLAEDLLWLFWAALPFLFGLIAAAGIGWGVNSIAARIVRK